ARAACLIMSAISKIAVCGAGAMGSGIAQVAAQAGASVKIFDVNPQALNSSEKQTRDGLAKLVARGKLTADQLGEIQKRMAWVSSLSALEDSDLVIEAIIEDVEIKGQLFEQLESVVKPDAIIATNTSSLPISRLARRLKHPE